MADEQYKWLNRETAERLLRGESLEAVDASARGQAERLARTLGALSVEATPAGVELPGEEGALAAFRKAREAAAEQSAVARGDGSQARRTGAASRPSDAGLVRLGGRPAPARGRPRWARPVRLALAAALAVGTVGGVAVAAGTGVLPVPFGDNDPGPAASVTAAGTPELPLASPSAGAAQGGTSGPPAPSAPATGGPATGPAHERTGTDPTPGGVTGSPGSRGRAPGPWPGASAACRDLRDGKELGRGRERLLEQAAGGPARVWAYCKGVLASTGGTQGDAGGKADGGNGSNGSNSSNGDKAGQDDQDDQGDRAGHGDHGNHGNHGNHGGRGGDDDGDSDQGRGNDHRQDGGAVSVPSAFAPQRSDSPALSPGSSPSPTYTAL
ncbi:hypothetical protein [Streptomyces shenzhenensis]|uniref:hypothetical protein n=1 Tax=Streptomyces shenzhenensis TaxID=943815 RepID=UPI0036950B14